MLTDRVGAAFDRVKGRTQVTWEMIAVAIGLSLLVNILASLLLVALDPDRRLSLILAAVVFVTLCAAGCGLVLYLRGRREEEWDGFRLLLPFRVDKDKGLAELLTKRDDGKNTGYAPIEEAGEFLRLMDETSRRRIFQGEPSGDPVKIENLRPGTPVWESIASLVEGLVFVAFRKYGINTLGDHARKHGEFRRFAGRLKKWELSRANWPQSLRESVFLSPHAHKDLWIPQGFFLSEESGPPSSTDLPRSTRRLTLSGVRCSITFSISGDWTHSSRRHRRTNLAALGIAPAENVHLLIIPVDIVLTMRGLYLRIRELEAEHFWLERFVDNVRRRMHWGEHMRKIVDRGEPYVSRMAGQDLDA